MIKKKAKGRWTGRVQAWIALFSLFFIAACLSSGGKQDFAKASPVQQEEIDEKIESIRYLQGKSLYAVLQRLIFIGDSAIPSLIEALDSEDAVTRSSAAYVLGEINYRHTLVFEALRDCAKDPVPEVRYESAASLLSLGDPSGAGVLIDGLKDKELKNRIVSFIALRECLSKDFDYDPKAPLAEREKSLKRWEEWWKNYQNRK